MPRTRKPYTQIRCTVHPMLEIMQRVKDSHLELLRRTPFGPLLEAFRNGTISKSHCKDSHTPILSLIKTFNPETTSFQLGSRDVAISTKDISHILGLPQHGDVVLFTSAGPNKSYKSDFTWRHFLREKRPRTRKLIHSILMNLLNGNEQTDIEDVVRLTLMELFTTFLFATHAVISWDLMKYCDDFGNLSRYSWAEAVGDFLHKSLKAQSRFDISGCGLLIPFWLCEKTNLIKPISGREVVEGHVPTLIKWSLPELNTKMQQINFSGIQPFLKEQDGVKAVINGENEKLEHNEAEIDQDEPKVENKGRGSSKRLGEDVEERRKLQRNNELSDVKNNLEERVEKMKINKAAQPNFQSPSVAIRPSPRDVVPNNKKTKKHPLTDPTCAVPSRSIQVPACKKDQLIVITEDCSATEEEERPRKRKCSRNESFHLERYAVFKLMDDEHQKKVKAFWNMAGSRELFWNGKNASVTREDVEKLIKDTAVSSNLIDAFMELLEQRQNSVTESTYISTLCWNYVSIQDARKQDKKGKINQVRDEARDTMGLSQIAFDPLLRSLGKIDYVFFPIITKFHFSLLVLNKNEKKWTHFNPLRKRSGLHLDPGYEVAKQMHLIIQKWLHTTQTEAPTMLLKGTRRKMTRQKPESWADVSLTEDEKISLTWMVDHDIDFKLENDLKCPQQDFKSLDCGIFIMYYMNQLSQGLPVEEEISQCRMWEFRKDLIERFADHESSWTQNSTPLPDDRIWASNSERR